MEKNEKLTLTVTEAAEALGISRPTVYRLIKSADFPLLSIGSRRLVPKKALEAWVEAQTGKGGVL